MLRDGQISIENLPEIKEVRYMLVRKIISVLAIVLLLAGPAFAFPYDPNPSEIDGTSTANGSRSVTNLFPGDWTNGSGSVNIDVLRLTSFWNNEFFALGGKGGATDLDMWNTPSFNADKMAQQQGAWEYQLTHPSGSTTAFRHMFTTHPELVACVETMRSLGRDRVTVEYLGEIPRGFPFPVLIFSNLKKHPTIPGGVDAIDRSPAELKKTKKPLVWIQGNIHGGEWSGGEGALACAYHLAQGKFDNLLDKINVIVVPRVCTDGAKLPIRETNDLVALQWAAADTRDLNRDNVLLDIHVTRAMRKMNMAYGPHFAIDLHERGGSSVNTNLMNQFGAKFDSDAGDIGSSGATILQVPRELMYLRYKYMEPDLARFGEKYGIYMGLYSEGRDAYAFGSGTAYSTWSGYVPHSDDVKVDPYGRPVTAYGPYSNITGANATWVTNRTFDPDAPYYVIPEASHNHRSSRNINAMPGVISQLFENKAHNNVGNRVMWERRVATGYVCMLSTMTTAANRGDELVPQLEAMRERWVVQGNTYDTNDKVPIITVPALPVYWNYKLDTKGDGFEHHRDYPYTLVDLGFTGTAPNASADDIRSMSRYDSTKAIKLLTAEDVAANVRSFDMGGQLHKWVSNDTGEGRYQPIKFEVTWQGWAVRERPRPTAYVFEGPYAEEVATRMLTAGIKVKRLLKDTTLNVTGWSYNRTPTVDFGNSGAGSWGTNNRDVKLFDIPNRVFKKDTFVVFLGQVMINLIPLYMEPDMPASAGNGIMLQYMSRALGGNFSGILSAQLVGKEMPIYRYIGNVNAIETYDMDFVLPLVNRGAVPRFFKFMTQDETANLAKTLNKDSIKVFDWDIQVHARKGNRTVEPALKDGKFDVTLPTTSKNSKYLIQKKDKSYEALVPHSKMVGWDVATIVVTEHGQNPFTVNMSGDRPAVGDGSNGTLARALPTWDDLIGVRVIEYVEDEILALFKPGKFPKGAVTTDNGFKYTELFEGTNTILSNSMLNGWKIVGAAPHSGEGWQAGYEVGRLYIKFTGEVYDEVIKVTLQKDGTTETKEIEIEFSGEKEFLWKKVIDKMGCNAGAAFLALLALCPLFLRRR
jgi:hypothetical protein